MIIALIVIAAAAGYALSLYLRPIHACPRCHGTRVTRTARGRISMCRRCDGTGRTRRLGATAVHRFYWSARGEQAQQRRYAAARRLQAGYQDYLDSTRAAGTRQAPPAGPHHPDQAGPSGQ